jgi:ABC-type spermidine/putrescine transport system permease subunit I
MISVISATMLGVMIMLLPILVLTPTYQYSTPEAILAKSNERFGDAQTLDEPDLGTVVFHSSVIQAGLVVFIGLITALGTSLYIKRRASFPSSHFLKSSPSNRFT